MTDYTVEVVFDFSLRDILSTKAFLSKLCDKHNAENYYFYEDPDIEKKNKTCILTVNFSEEDMYAMVIFIREIKRTSKIYLDAVYNNNNKLYYASKTYMGLMNKEMSKKIKVDIKKIYNEEDSILIRELNTNATQ